MMKNISAGILRECSRCGDCCRGSHRWGLLVVPSDLDRWRRERRDDILRYIRYSKNSSFAAIIWKELQTHLFCYQCPFLEELTTGHYQCTIHDTKPHICQQFACTWRLGKGPKTLGMKTFGWYATSRDTAHQVRS